MAEEDNLDVLCDLLEDSDDEKDETIGSQLDDSFDEQIFNLNDKEVAKIEAVKKPDDNSNSKKNIEKPKDEKPAENENKTQVNEMEEKLRKMQEEMAKMQKELEAAKKPRTLEEIDVLQASTSQSASNAPREPVYTNPFAEQDKPRKSAGYHGETPLFGPKLAQKTSRVLTGEDKIKFEQDMKKRHAERKMAKLVANDLAYSR